MLQFLQTIHECRPAADLRRGHGFLAFGSDLDIFSQDFLWHVFCQFSVFILTKKAISEVNLSTFIKKKTLLRYSAMIFLKEKYWSYERIHPQYSTQLKS